MCTEDSLKLIFLKLSFQYRTIYFCEPAENVMFDKIMFLNGKIFHIKYSEKLQSGKIAGYLYFKSLFVLAYFKCRLFYLRVLMQMIAVSALMIGTMLFIWR